MRIKNLIFSIFLLTAALFSSSFAQDNTQVGLPEGVIARLGKGGINIMRFSPDGTHLAVGTDVGLWLYDVRDEKETALFTEHTGQVNALVFSQSGNILTNGGENDKAIQFWSLETLTNLTSIKLMYRHNQVAGLAFLGETLISLDRWGKVIYWDVDAGEKLYELSKKISYAALAFAEDGSMFATSSTDGAIYLWRATNNQQRIIHIDHKMGYDHESGALSFSPDGKILASGSNNSTVKLWDTQSLTHLATLFGHQGWITAVAFSKDGKILASGATDSVIKLWDVNTHQERATLTGHKNTINALTFAPDGENIYSGCLASGSADGTILFSDPNTGEKIATFTEGHTEWTKEVAFSDDDTTLVSTSYNGTVDVYNLKNMKELTTFTMGHNDATQTVALSPNAKLFACHGSKGKVAFNYYGTGMSSETGYTNNLQLWNITTSEKLIVPRHSDRGRALTAIFSPDSNILATGGLREIQICDVNSGHVLFHFSPSSPLYSRAKMVFSPDGKKLATLNPSDNPQIWDISKQRDVTPSDLPEGNAVAFSPDSKTFAVAGTESIYLRELDREGKNERIITPNHFHVFETVITFSPDGTILIGTDMKHLKVVDVETGKRLITLSGHTEPIETLKFSHNGKTLASGSQDGTILLWDWEKIRTKAKENKGN